MKKSLIALAVAGTFAAPAFAASSNADVYGVLNAAVTFLNDEDSAANGMQVSTFGSRLGVKGSEDLGGGLKAVWQVESSIDFEEQTGTLAGRNSFVGLAGGFGTVLLGNHDSPLKLVGRKLDLFGDSIGDSRNIMGFGSDARVDNAVVYVSPNMSGVTFIGAYFTDNLSSATTSPDADDDGAFNVSVDYSNGPLYLGFAYGDGDHHENAGLDEHMRFGAGYTMGDLKFVGQYDVLEYDGGGDYEAWMVGAAYTMGAIVLKANYMAADDDGFDDISQWSVGADYNLSKRTRVYALYTDGENVILGSGAGSSDRIAPDSDDVSGLSVGVAHSF